MARPKADQVSTESKRKVDRNDYVSVMNNTTGTLIYINDRTMQQWLLEGFGAIDEMQVSDLVTMKSSQPKFLTEGWLIVLDEEVIQYLGLSEMYKYMVKPSEIEQFFALPDDKITEIVKKAPDNMKLIIAKKAKEYAGTSVLDSIRKQNLIESLLNINLKE